MSAYASRRRHSYIINIFKCGKPVYISRRLWDNGVAVIGLNRYKSRYATETVPLAWIENIRFSRVFDPSVLEIMTNTDELLDMWWLYKNANKVGAAEYAQILNRVKSGDKEALAQYKRDVMERFCF